jgi:hypothetical protein
MDRFGRQARFERELKRFVRRRFMAVSFAGVQQVGFDKGQLLPSLGPIALRP